MGFHRKAVLAAALALALSGPGLLLAQTGTVESIEVQGLVRMTSEAFAHAFGIRKGETYDPARIQAQFRRLWDLGVFEDITIEAEDAPGGGKALIVKVKEKKILSSVTYEENKVLTRTAIEDGLKERKVRLELGKPLDRKAVFAAAQTIRDLLGQKGYLDPVVKSRFDDATTETSVSVSFAIRPGAKTRIREIDFIGNSVYSDRQLVRQLKLTKEWHWWWPFSSKSLYHPAKWDQDTGAVRDAYLNAGYLDVEIRPPVVEVRELVKEPKRKAKKKKGDESDAEEAAEVRPVPAPETAPETAELSPRERRKEAERARKRAERARKRAEKELARSEPKVRRWAHLVVEIVEGPKYTAGELRISGNKVIEEPAIRPLVALKEGELFNKGLLDASVKIIQAAYQNRGHAYATVRHEIERRPGETVADFTIVVNEDKPYYVSRIEFTGNTSTQDRVLRREFQIAEGDLFSRRLLDISVAKVNQLGYFEAKSEDVVIEPAEGSDRVRVTVPGEEKGRNEIQIGGGYSGIDGAFFTGFYSTRNLLGRGQVLSISAQLGGRANRYVLSFQEPWFLGRPVLFGASLFRRDVDFGRSQRSSSEGGSIAVGRRLGVFSQASLRYDFQDVSSTGFTFDGREARNTIQSLTPSFLYNKIDNPYRPTKGWSLGLDGEIAGGPLGGDTNFLRPRLTTTSFFRPLKKGFLGLHVEAGWIRPWQGGSSDNTANVEGLPRFERFWLGGDTLGPRIFETRSVTPLRYVRLDEFGRIVETAKDPRGRPSSDFDRNGDGIVNRLDLVDVGGNRFLLFQGEYVIPVAGPFEVALFLDVANVLFEDETFGTDELRASAGIEARFYVPVFPVPLRLIYGVPLRKLPEDRTSGFTFSIGRSF